MPRTVNAGCRAARTVILRAVVVLAGALPLALAFATAPGVAAPPPPPTASFVYSPSAPLINQGVTFTSTSTASDAKYPIVLYTWDLDGNGSFETSTGPQPAVARLYPAPGDVKVSLRVKDKRGSIATATRVVTISASSPSDLVPSFSYSPLAPVAGESVSFFSTSTDTDSPIVSQQWDLDGNGAFGETSGSMAIRTFPEAGSYIVSLRVTDQAGATAVVTQIVVVRAKATVAA